MWLSKDKNRGFNSIIKKEGNLGETIEVTMRHSFL
jgi:hypothetical protein